MTYTIRKSGAKRHCLYGACSKTHRTTCRRYLQQIFGEAAGRFEDQQLIEGDGTTEPQGLRTVATDGPVTASNASAVVIAGRCPRLVLRRLPVAVQGYRGMVHDLLVL